MKKAEVRLTLASSDYQALLALLKFTCGRISTDEFTAIIGSIGWSTEGHNVTDLVTRVADAIVPVIV